MSESAIKSICYEPCNVASIAAKNIGKTEQLCKDGSEFRTAYAQCATCLKDPAQSPTDLLSDGLLSYLSYCKMDLVYTTSIISISDGISTTQVVQSIPTSPATTESEKSLSTTLTISSTQTASGSVHFTPTETSISPTGSKATGDDSTASKMVWITGPVIGSVAAITLIIFVVFYIWRRRTNPIPAKNMDELLIDHSFEKPQLHGDCIQKPSSSYSYEMPAHVPTSFPNIHEKPAEPMPIQELPAEEILREDSKKPTPE